MKFTLLITQECNLRCKYCYIDKNQSVMSTKTSKKIIDYIFDKSLLCDEKIDVGFFGGEPLLEFDLIKKITNIIKSHQHYDSERVNLSIVTNGTIFSDEIVEFIIGNNIGFGISCDGPPFVQDLFRRSILGDKTSGLVEETIKKAKQAFSNVIVNAVYHPNTLRFLPQSIEYFSSLGVKQIYLSPDYSAHWQKEDADLLPEIYNEIGEIYMKYYLEGKPRFISLLDSKITVILRSGFDFMERCRMGKAEFAFTPNGDIYPCERLVGNGNNNHCIGNINDGILQNSPSCHLAPGSEINSECMSCGLKDYCMNWCGCSNYLASGYYNRVSPFLCASEKAAIETSFNVFQILEKKIGPTFYQHVSGLSVLNSVS